MITAFINDLVNFLHAAVNFALVVILLKFVLRVFFGIRLPKFTLPRFVGVKSHISGRTHSKEWYDLQKFKYQARLDYKFSKYELRVKARQDRKKSSRIASLPDYFLRIVK